MKTAIVDSDDMKEFGRMDAKFLILHSTHKDVCRELMDGFTFEELLDLARALPFDRSAALAVYPGVPQRSGRIEQIFERWLNYLGGLDRPVDRRCYAPVAVYCAASSQWLVSKVLEEVLVLSQQKHAKLQALLGLLKVVEGKNAPMLLAAMKHGGAEKLREVRTDAAQEDSRVFGSPVGSDPGEDRKSSPER